MTQYAYFDHTVSAPSPVIGWIDTEVFGTFPNLPVTQDLYAMTTDQWTARLNGHWAVTGGALIAYTPPPPAIDTRPLAQIALDKSDVTMIRCFEHGIAVPSEWTTYRASLRAIVAGSVTTTSLPTMPAYPAGS